MKKTTLLLCLFVVSVMMPQVMWADVPVISSWSISDTTFTVNSAQEGYLNGLEKTSEMKACKRIVLNGKFNAADLTSIQTSGDDFKFKIVDMKDAKFPTDQSNYRICLCKLESDLPSSGNDRSMYLVGGVYYQGVQSNKITILEGLQIGDIPSGVNWRDDKWEYQKNIITDDGWYKLVIPVYYQKKGHYVKVVNPSGDYVEVESIPSLDEKIDNNNNIKVKIDDTSTYEYYIWEKYWGPISSLPDNFDVNKSENYQISWTPENIVSYNNQGGDIGSIVGINSGTYNYCHIYKPFEWTQTEYSGNDTWLDKINQRYNNVKDAPAPNSASDKIVVGGSPHYYYDNIWVAEESNTRLIRFGNWSNLQTAILPADIRNIQLHDDVFSNCSKVTMVVSGNTFATIEHSEYPTALIQNYSTEAERERLRYILLKSSFVADGKISWGEIVENEGYNSDTKKYVLKSSLADSDKMQLINSQANLKVLDLKDATDVTPETLSLLTNGNIEYIVLPGDKTKSLVCDTTNYYESGVATPRMSNLKAVISAQSTNLVAHVVKAGSLAQARCYATGLKENRDGKPAVKGLTSVTLSGELKADDISTHDEDKGLSGENYTITSIDLEKAIFVDALGHVDCSQMNFQAAGFQGNSNECVLKNIKLPFTPRMTDIPKDCFRNMKSLDSLCIPFNYKHIHNGALYDSNVEHLTTTDSIGGAVIDNGKYTYTLSASLEEIGDAPSPKLNSDGKPNGTEIYVFPKENGVTEIYSLATKVPKCYREAFSFDVTFGYGGQDETKVYCRDRYFNNGERQKSFVVLRYPSEEVFNRRKKKGKPVETSYELMRQKYTDITKEYTKKDQTGAVDANGDPLLWPSRTEMNRSYNQAGVGALWEDWTKSYTGSYNSEINFDEDPVVYSARNGGSLRNAPNRSTTRNINLEQGMTQYVERSESNGTYTFTPTADVQNMFQYLNMPVTYDDVTYNKIVINFAEPVPEGFFIHHYGERGTYYSLKGLTKYEFALTGSPIDDFTIFNWDSYWGEGFEYEAQQDRRNIKISAAYLTSDQVDPVTTTSKYHHESNIAEDFIDYMGWHQIVLTQAVYYEPVEKEVEEEVTSCRYEDAGWFTFCIPYDMTYSQVVKMLGVPASTDKVKNYIGNSETPETTDIMPSIRQLSQVERWEKGSDKEKNKVIFRLTPELADKSNHTAKYLEFTENATDNSSTMKYLSAGALEKANQSVKDPICLVGGRPYIIKAYKRKGETISEDNLGMFIMKRYSDEFGELASCVNSGAEYCEQLKTYTYNDDETVKSYSDGGVTLRFAKPYEKHKVQAVDGRSNSKSSPQLTFTNDEEKERPYYYTMVGQFWEQDLPDYCIYMYKGHWYRYTNAETLKYKWVPYKCVILATPEKTTVTDADKNEDDIKMPIENITTGGGFRDLQKCYFPMNKVGTFDWIPNPLKLCFYGRDDYYFNNQLHVGESSSHTRYIFTMEDDDDIVDYEDEVTTVKTIDMLDGVPQKSIRSTRVYSISGQYMGESTEGLSKGVYIVGGRKIVVD